MTSPREVQKENSCAYKTKQCTINRFGKDLDTRSLDLITSPKHIQIGSSNYKFSGSSLTKRNSVESGTESPLHKKLMQEIVEMKEMEEELDDPTVPSCAEIEQPSFCNWLADWVFCNGITEYATNTLLKKLPDVLDTCKNVDLPSDYQSLLVTPGTAGVNNSDQGDCENPDSTEIQADSPNRNSAPNSEGTNQIIIETSNLEEIDTSSNNSLKREGSTLSEKDVDTHSHHSSLSNKRMRRCLNMIATFSETVATLDKKVDRMEKALVSMQNSFTNDSSTLNTAFDNEFARLKSLEEFDRLESTITTEEERFQALTQYFSRIGGHDMKQTTRKILNRIMDNQIQAQFNMYGQRGKRKFADSKTYEAIKIAVKRAHQAADDESIKICVMNHLKYASKRVRNSDV